MLLRKFIIPLLLLFITSVGHISVGHTAELVSYPPQRVLGFRGLDTHSSEPNIADSRASDLKNVKLSAALDLRKRFGYSVINGTLDHADTANSAVTGIFDSEFSNGNSWTLAFVGPSIWYDNAGTWTRFSLNSITSGANNQFQCVMALDTAVCTNDVDEPLEVSSTPTKTDLSFTGLSNAVTKAKTLRWFRNYLIFGNTYENSIERPTRFRWPNVGTTETWTDDDFVDIATFAGDEIIGFAELYGDLYIFLKRSIWKASLVGGDDIFIFTKIVDGIGAIARDSIITVNLAEQRSGVLFLSESKNIYLFNGVSVQDAGFLIQPTLDNLNEARIQYTVATYDGHNYLLSATTGANSENDTVYDLQTEIMEWSVYDQIDANAFAQVKESTSLIKTYFGNYDSFVYWFDNPDLNNDVDGATGIVDSVGTVNVTTATGAQVIVDTTIASGTYTGAIVRITSGTGVGNETVVLTNLAGDTGIVVTTPFSTTPDSTSVYSIGDIDAQYTTKWYELGDAAREKAFLGMLFFGEEASSNQIDIGYAIDFGSSLDSKTISLSPTSASLWDSAIWDESIWGTTGNKIYTSKLTGLGNFIQFEFSNDSIDETFHLFGYNILATQEALKQ